MLDCFNLIVSHDEVDHMLAFLLLTSSLERCLGDVSTAVSFCKSLHCIFCEEESRKKDEEENERGRDRERRKALWVRRRETFERKSRTAGFEPATVAPSNHGKSRVVTSQWWRIWLRCYHPWLSFWLAATITGLNPAVRLFLSKSLYWLF